MRGLVRQECFQAEGKGVVRVIDRNESHIGPPNRLPKYRGLYSAKQTCM